MNIEADQRAAAHDAVARDGHVLPLGHGNNAPGISGFFDGTAASTHDQVEAFWGPKGTHRGRGVAIATGLSGIVVIDLDTPGGDHANLEGPWASVPGVVDGCDILAVLCEQRRQPWPITRTVRTPSGGGRHLIFQAPAGIDLRPSAGKIAPLIDVRAGRSIAFAPGSWRPKGRYTVTVDLPLAPLPSWITELALRATFRATPTHSAKSPADLREFPTEPRPGDDFNNRGDWATILEPHGWTRYRTEGHLWHWTRPGKSRCTSATTGPRGDADYLYVFTSGAAPLEADRSYSRFAAYAVLNHGGDHKAAARALRQLGYGTTQTGTAA